MAREKRDHLTDGDVFRMIYHDTDLPTNMTIEDIKSVFLIYKDIVQRCIINGIDVPIPNIGLFSKVRKKGWKGRRLKVREDIFDQSNTNYVYKDIESKPDFWDMKFEFKKSFHNATKEEMN